MLLAQADLGCQGALSRSIALSVVIIFAPVTLPPGRAMLTTMLSIGSQATTTIGIESVASLAAFTP